MGIDVISVLIDYIGKKCDKKFILIFTINNNNYM